MAEVKIESDRIDIKISLLDMVMSFHGSFSIPLSHVTNAYVSSFEDLDLQYKLSGSNLGYETATGVFGSPQGLVFVDVDDGGDCLVIETQGEKFPRIAVQPGSGQNANDLAHAIMRAVPDSGPVE
ncbi:MAG TPA: hypothetical protein VFB22_03880 [Candidatus Baltobacteraceae bacterium]|nr:hypothetical protein [Candidatus Baltobacteraceae bacterium]